MNAVASDRVPLSLIETDGKRVFKPRPLFRGPATALSSDLIPADLELVDDALPDEGITLQRRYKFARSADGSAHLWVEYVKTVGATAPSSGLLFDRLISVEPSES